jgi:hypothetical protein
MTIFLIILGIVIFIVVRGYIVGGKRLNGFYQVLNSKGTPIHFGTWSECMQHAKAQREYCRTFGITETFTVKEKKL